MRVSRLRSARSVGFVSTALYRRAEQPVTARYLRHTSSFLIATFALVAFVGGNMMGMHGWHVFWKSVLGKVDDSLIVYTGTVAPVDLAPDYDRWSEYGGSAEDHQFRQVPRDLLVPLPRYGVDATGMPTSAIYSVGYMGSYDGHEGAGSHPGIDIRLPPGTPVVAVMNGIVETVDTNAGGYGKYVVLRHPNVPDPDNPKQTTTLYSAYAHLSAQLVTVGQIVDKDEPLGLSGQTGNASGPHLHFQIDREVSLNGEIVPFHPYWPFNDADMRSSRLSFNGAVNNGLGQSNAYAFTVHPMRYVQDNFPSTAIVRATTGTKHIVAMADPNERPRAASSSSVNIAQRLAAARNSRLQQRVAERSSVVRVSSSSTSSSSSSLPSSSSAPVVAVASVTPPRSTASASQQHVAGISIDHNGKFESRAWTEVRFTLLDAAGNRASGGTLQGSLYLRTAFGIADFDPPVLTAQDFHDGVAVAKILPRGTQTVVIDVKPFNALSKPLKYAGR